MASLTYLHNKAKSVVIHATANSTIVVAGNNTVSNVTSNSSQVVHSGSIARVVFGAQTSGYWNVLRGSNLVATFTGTGHVLFDGMPLSVDSTGTLVLQLNGTANGFIMVELHKQGNY